MSGKNLRYVQQSFRARIEHDLVLTRMGEMTVRDIDALTRALLYQLTGKTAAIMEGLEASPVGNLDVELTAPGTVILNLGDQNVRFAIDHNGDAPFSVTLDAADPTDPRIDIIEGTIKTRSAFSDSVVDVVDPITKTVTPQLRDRDFEVYIEVRKKTGTPAPGPTAPSPTAGSAGVLTGTVAIAGTIDLSAEYIINLAVGNDTEYVEVDCRGAIPAATTAAEILTALNGAGFGVIAAQIAGDFIELTAPGQGENSVIRIKQPTDPSTDALNNIFGLSESVGYFVQYAGANPYFKIAEVNVAATQTVLNPTDVKPRADKDTDWTADAATILNGFSLQAHRESAPMDHAPASVESFHLAPSSLALVQGKTTRVGGASINAQSTGFGGPARYLVQRTYPIQSVVSPDTARMQTLNPTKTYSGVIKPTIELTDKAGTPLDWFHVEQQNPLSRVDQREEDTTGNYSVQTSLSEAAADKIPFTPSTTTLFSDRFKRFGVFLKNKGSGYTSLVFDFHDSGNNLLFSRSIPYASLNDNAGAGAWNYVSHGLLGNIYTLVPGNTYHVHCYVVGFTVGTTPTLGMSATNLISYREMYYPEPGLGVASDDAPYIQQWVGLAPTGALVTHGPNDDDLAPFAGESVLDIMAVDLSSEAYWQAFTYQNYIAVDVKTGRIKVPLNLNVFQYLWSFNVTRSNSSADALTLKIASADADTNQQRTEGATLQQLYENLKLYLKGGWPSAIATEIYEYSLPNDGGGRPQGRRRLQKLRIPLYQADMNVANFSSIIEFTFNYHAVGSPPFSGGSYGTSNWFSEYELSHITIQELFDGAVVSQLGLVGPVAGIQLGRITFQSPSQNNSNW